ncbi:hypothetical protein BC936DRAFT_144098 [Jimgerdemannia flammicorona]|uniref:GATA-type domain-containing protein n=1 Tax=Jimgerdemannia flammicorona TaxID=994334 RepID=A0A433DM52_9FUNG|nr:hypothetical protein BC936DRAFT_144098 [Jimgerdemannia flammicorona]
MDNRNFANPVACCVVLVCRIAPTLAVKHHEFVQIPERSVRDPSGVLYNFKTSCQYCGYPRHTYLTNGINGQRNESTDRETESTDRETESTDRETESTDRETESTDKETESTDRETESTDKETEYTY